MSVNADPLPPNRPNNRSTPRHPASSDLLKKLLEDPKVVAGVSVFGFVLLLLGVSLVFGGRKPSLNNTTPSPNVVSTPTPTEPPILGEKLGDDYETPSDLFSPNGRWAVALPKISDPAQAAKDNRLNKVIQVSTRRVVCSIQGRPGFNLRLNHQVVLPPKWSSDSSLVYWKVDGKWFPTALALIRIEQGKELWQLNLLARCQEEILQRTRSAQPKRYEAAKKRNKGNGAAFPDGFTLDLSTDADDADQVRLPLTVRVSLSANPKELPSFPAQAELDSSLTGTVSADGKWSVQSFAITKPTQ